MNFGVLELTETELSNLRTVAMLGYAMGIEHM